MLLLTNLISYWKLDESSGNAADSASTNTLTNNNVVTYGPGQINNGAIMASASSQYLSITDGAQSGLDLSGDCSFSFWLNTTSSSTFQLITKYVPTGSQRSWTVNLQTNKLAFEYSSNGSNADEHLSDAFTINTGTWYYFTIVFTAATHSVDFYRNGTLLNTDNSGTLTSIFDSTAPFILGTRGDLVGYLNGKLDEVGIWSRTLTSVEVAQLYNSGSGLSYPFALPAPSLVKTVNGLAIASIATFDGLAISSVQSINGLMDQNIVISQVYGGGGVNAGSTYQSDFVELHNSGASAVNLSGWSIQYTTNTGSLWIKQNLSGTIAAGAYYLISMGTPAGPVGINPLPTPDITASPAIFMATGAGKVALVNNTTLLSTNGTPVAPLNGSGATCPTVNNDHIVDFVGYGTGGGGAACWEGTASAPTLLVNTSAQRNSSGCTDTNDNSADFTSATPNPRNSASATHTC